MVSKIRWAAFFIFLTLLSLLGDGKQHVSLVLVCGGVLALYAHDWYTARARFFIDARVLFGWLGVFLSLLFSSTWTLSLGYSVTGLVRYVAAFLLFVYFSNNTTKDSVPRAGTFLYVWSIFMTVVAVIFIAIPSLQSYVPRMNLLYKSYGHNHLVDILFFVLPFSLVLLRKKKNVWFLLGFLVTMSGFLVSFSRGAVLLVLGYLLYYVVFRIQKSKITRVLIGGIITSVLLSAFVLFSSKIAYPQFLNYLNQSVQKSTIIESRAQYWTQAFLGFSSRPLLGRGPGSFFLQSKRYQRANDMYSWYAHSLPLEILSESGLVGLIAVSLLCISLARCAKRNKAEDREKSFYSDAIKTGLVLTLAYSFIEMNLNFIVIWLLFWVMLAISLCSVSEKKMTGKTTQVPGIVFVLTIAVVALYYAQFVCASVFLMISHNPRIAWFIEPHSEDRATSYISVNKNKYIPVWPDQRLLRLFHRFDGDVLYALTQIKNPEKPLELYGDLIETDKQNTVYLSAYIQYLLSKGQPRRVGKLLNVIKTTDFISPEFMSLYSKELFNEVGTPPQLNEYIAKTYYLLGLRLLRTDPAITRTLWEAAKDSAPSWGYFYIELASLEVNIFHDNERLAKILSACKNEKFARASCKDIQISDYPPGSQIDHVKAIPAIYKH